MLQVVSVFDTTLMTCSFRAAQVTALCTGRLHCCQGLQCYYGRSQGPLTSGHATHRARGRPVEWQFAAGGGTFIPNAFAGKDGFAWPLFPADNSKALIFIFSVRASNIRARHVRDRVGNNSYYPIIQMSTWHYYLFIIPIINSSGQRLLHQARYDCTE